MVKNRWEFPAVSGGVLGQFSGIAGMLIAVPVTAVLKVFFSMYYSFYRSSAFFAGI